MLKMDRDYYMDDHALVLEHTLIRLTGGAAQFRVPSVFGDISVQTVGSEALVLKDVEELTFDSGYIEWKDYVLHCPSTLRRVFLPETAEKISPLMLRSNIHPDLDLYLDRALTPEVFHDIHRHALHLGSQGHLITSELLEMKEMEPVCCLMKNNAAPAEIHREMGILFVKQNPAVSGNKLLFASVFEAQSCYGFVGSRTQTEEYTVVMEMIRRGDNGWHDPGSEMQADLNLRSGRPPYESYMIRSVSFAMVEALPTAPGRDGKYHVRFHLFQRFAFFPSLWQIRHQGKDWWIYSRNYLTGVPERPYFREEMGVFNREGLVTDRKTSEDVYAKYRLLSVL